MGGNGTVGGRRAGGRPPRRVRQLTLILDAAPLIALGDSQDPSHTVVDELLSRGDEELILPAPVSAEVDYLIRRRGGRTAARKFLADIADGGIRVESMTRGEHGIALDIDAQYEELDVGLADLSVIVLAHRFRTTRLVTFDERHFRAVAPIGGGAFTILPADR